MIKAAERAGERRQLVSLFLRPLYLTRDYANRHRGSGGARSRASESYLRRKGCTQVLFARELDLCDCLSCVNTAVRHSTPTGEENERENELKREGGVLCISRTEDFPADWSPHTTICGSDTNSPMPYARRLSIVLRSFSCSGETSAPKALFLRPNSVEES